MLRPIGSVVTFVHGQGSRPPGSKADHTGRASGQQRRGRSVRRADPPPRGGGRRRKSLPPAGQLRSASPPLYPCRIRWRRSETDSARNGSKRIAGAGSPRGAEQHRPVAHWTRSAGGFDGDVVVHFVTPALCVVRPADSRFSLPGFSLAAFHLILPRTPAFENLCAPRSLFACRTDRRRTTRAQRQARKRRRVLR